jgi:hypothetical protein
MIVAPKIFGVCGGTGEREKHGLGNIAHPFGGVGRMRALVCDMFAVTAGATTALLELPLTQRAGNYNKGVRRAPLHGLLLAGAGVRAPNQAARQGLQVCTSACAGVAQGIARVSFVRQKYVD